MEIRSPRLLVDWHSVNFHHGAHLVSQEAFFSCCFAMLIGGFRAKLSQDHDVWYFLKHFGVLWSLVSNASDYATRFNDDDLYHTVLWGGCKFIEKSLQLLYQCHFGFDCAAFWTVRCALLVFMT